jgi:transposase InsO family protein
MVGHWGVEHTLTLLDELLIKDTRIMLGKPDWVNKRQDVRHMVEHCPICQKTRYFRLVTQTKRFSTSTYGVMENLAIDGLKMPHKCPRGFEWVIVIADSFSRYVQVYPAYDCSSKTAVECLIQWTATFGIPSHIRTDNSSQFAGEYAEILRLLKIQQHYIQAYSHQENGLIEAANKQLLRHLGALLLENRSKEYWHIMMYVATRILNCRVVKATGISAQDLVFAGRLDLNRGVLFPRKVHESESISDYMRVSMELQEEMLQTATQQQRDTDEAHLSNNSQILPTVFDMGILVLAARETPDKLAPQWKGPYLTTHREARLEGDVYTCEDLTSGKSYDFRVNQLRVYNYDEFDMSPADVSHLEHQAYVVESIVTHKFDPKPPTAANLRLLVKWQGYVEPEWQLYDTETRKLALVHDYLRSKGLAKLISKAYRQTI